MGVNRAIDQLSASAPAIQLIKHLGCVRSRTL